MRPSSKIRNYVRLRVGLSLMIAGLIAVGGPVSNTATIASAQTVSPSWNFTGNLNTARHSHTATMLPNGKVLVAAGFGATGVNAFNFLNSAELYDRGGGIWTTTGSLTTARAFHTATLLTNGKVLVAGGSDQFVIHNGAELYDPATGTWSSTGNLNAARRSHTATLLPNGKVLIAGGFNIGDGDPNSAELYDPATGLWTSTGNLNTTRSGHTATLLQSGKVLIVGGGGLSSAELYDPATGVWSITGNLNAGREFHTATLLPSGKVLVTSEKSAELYDPGTGTWVNTGDLNRNASFTATLLLTGKVLVAGSGVNDDDSDFNTSELYGPATGTWTISAEPNTFRTIHTATLLPDGKVLIAGGNRINAINSAELYDPGTSSTPNQIDDADFFVRQHYRDFLNRDPDADGLAFWTNEITSCGTDPGCIESKRINVSAAFFLSIEFQQTGYLVYRIYKSSYGTLPGAPIPVTLSEFLPDTHVIGQGVVVNQPGWEQVLETNKQAFTVAFVQRPRFTSAYPTSLTPDQFVDQLFTNAGVTPSGTERADAINEFGMAMTSADTLARARALRRVAETSTLAQQEFNEAFVLMQYFGYLRRNPNDPPEPGSNFDGYHFWLNKLDQFNGSFVSAEMVKSFLISTEYRQRFGQP